jgi:prepilin-type N-terminal cleavage/methylation domain-containing protein
MFWQNLKNDRQKNKAARGRGFTLVEMMVSLFIFSMTMGVVGQLFLYSLKMQRQMSAHNKLINELSYSMERISRGLRMAQKDMTGTCIGQYENFEKTTDTYGDHIKFKSPDTSFVSSNPIDCIEYYLDDYYSTGVTSLMESRSNEGGAFSDYSLPLTSPAIDVQTFSITESGWSQNDDSQPRVVVHIVAVDGEGQNLEVQMTVSQRNIDIRY